jgi:hypothetical protein
VGKESIGGKFWRTRGSHVLKALENISRLFNGIARRPCERELRL